jgi:hypothetical protein
MQGQSFRSMWNLRFVHIPAMMKTFWQSLLFFLMVWITPARGVPLLDYRGSTWKRTPQQGVSKTVQKRTKPRKGELLGRTVGAPCRCAQTCSQGGDDWVGQPGLECSTWNTGRLSGPAVTKNSTRSPAVLRRIPSAMWLRQELPVQRRRSFIGMDQTPKKQAVYSSAPFL